MNIYVGNLPYSATDADLREAFAHYGDVSNVQLISDKFTGESKGFGFVEMDNNSQADAAIKGLNGTAIKGRNITVNQAKPEATVPRTAAVVGVIDGLDYRSARAPGASADLSEESPPRRGFLRSGSPPLSGA
jgi:RNA recognition motif-containing protein